MASGAAGAADSGDGQDRHVVVRNASSQPINEFYASRVGVDDWQEDILGKDTIAPGHEVNVNVDDGSGTCQFDFKAVMADGRSIEHRNVNVCDGGMWTISDDT